MVVRLLKYRHESSAAVLGGATKSLQLLVAFLGNGYMNFSMHAQCMCNSHFSTN